VRFSLLLIRVVVAFGVILLSFHNVTRLDHAPEVSPRFSINFNVAIQVVINVNHRDVVWPNDDDSPWRRDHLQSAARGLMRSLRLRPRGALGIVEQGPLGVGQGGQAGSTLHDDPAHASKKDHATFADRDPLHRPFSRPLPAFVEHGGKITSLLSTEPKLVVECRHPIGDLGLPNSILDGSLPADIRRAFVGIACVFVDDIRLRKRRV
jgi:hypothetical protein